MPPPLASPSPLMGAVHLLLFSVLSAVPLFPPHSCFVLRWGASDDLGCPLPSPPAGLAQGARVSAWEVPPPSPSWSGVPPPPSPAGLAQGAHVTDRGGPPFLRLMAAHCGSVLSGRGVPLSPLDARGKRVLLGEGSSPFSIFWLQAGGARFPVRVSPYIPWMCAVSARFRVGGLPPSSISSMRAVSARC